MLDHQKQEFLLDEVNEFFIDSERWVLKSVFERKFRHAQTKMDRLLKNWPLSVKESFLGPESFAFLEEAVFKRFRADMERFVERYKETIEKTIERGQKGNTQAIFKLIEWDKAFIGLDFIVQKVVEAQHNDTKKDREFLERLADKFSGRSKVIRKIPVHQDIIWMVEIFTLGSTPSHDQLKEIHKIFENGGLFYGEKEVSPLGDFSYFQKYLRRNGVIV